TSRLRPAREAVPPNVSGDSPADSTDRGSTHVDDHGNADGAAAIAAAEDAAAAEELARARRGDRDAFRLLVERHQHKVFHWVLRTVRCDRDMAADLCQEVFLRVHRGLPGFDGRAKFTTWLH